MSVKTNLWENKTVAHESKKHLLKIVQGEFLNGWDLIGEITRGEKGLLTDAKSHSSTKKIFYAHLKRKKLEV